MHVYVNFLMATVVAIALTSCGGGNNTESTSSSSHASLLSSSSATTSSANTVSSSNPASSFANTSSSSMSSLLVVTSVSSSTRSSVIAASSSSTANPVSSTASLSSSSNNISSNNNVSSSSSKTSSSSTSSLSSSQSSSGVPAGYSLVWSDEFDKDGLPDSKKWVYDTEANATGWYNNEKQYYAVARLENSEVTNGKLVITARKEALTSEKDYGGQAYSSARLITLNKASWTYGFFEVRAKMPCGKGSWPAIWMLGEEGEWPAGGEIDIMEQVGKAPTAIEGTIHTSGTAGTNGDGSTTYIKDACSNFHNYQLTWTPDSLVIAVDNNAFHTYKNQNNGPTTWPFDKPQYMLLNLAIGGDMAGAIDDSIFPIKYEIDYVRIYQKQ